MPVDDRLRALEEGLAAALLLDRHALARGLSRLRRLHAKHGEMPAGELRTLDKLEARLATSQQRVRARQALAHTNVPLNETLPVATAEAEIRAALDANQVVVVCGATGSGKTTQLPRICMRAGRGIHGRIGHTQPRRIAARAVARRIQDEWGPGGDRAVGWTVRFRDHTKPEALVKVMTDGILLAETQRDPQFLAYDTIILDEAHERSLNIDFLLGYLTRLLRQRTDLKLIVTSATLDPGRFAEHFEGAPVIQVEGRTYPVTIRYRPPRHGRDEPAPPLEVRVADALRELLEEEDGDVLVFLATAREIREVGSHLQDLWGETLDVLPLHARLSIKEQDRVFRTGKQRRVVLATNVAETSLTVPGIRHVIDAGRARLLRYSERSRIQRLPIEGISQASAKQRAGRCGRVAPGTCTRLYSEADHDARGALHLTRAAPLQPRERDLADEDARPGADRSLPLCGSARSSRCAGGVQDALRDRRRGPGGRTD